MIIEEPPLLRLHRWAWVRRKLYGYIGRRLALSTAFFVIISTARVVAAPIDEPIVPEDSGFFSKPVIVVTEMGVPEKQLVAKKKKAKAAGGAYSSGYCTAYAASRRPDLPKNLGNAKTWISRASAQGYQTGLEPSIGAVVQTHESNYGHVAYVEGIDGDYLLISEENYKGRYIISTRRLAIDSKVIVGYIK